VVQGVDYEFKPQYCPPKKGIRGVTAKKILNEVMHVLINLL
jgi:hypothetical protein